MNFVTRGDLYKLGYSEEVTSWDITVSVGERLERADELARKTYLSGEKHKAKMADRRTNDTNERNKYNGVPRSRRGQTPTPVHVSPSYEAREIRGQPVPNRQWKKGTPPPSDRPPRKENVWEKFKMSESEYRQHLSDGLCLRCHKKGHVSRNCPDANVIRASSSSRPPGKVQIASASLQAKESAPRLSIFPENVPDQTTVCMHEVGVDGIDFGLSELDEALPDCSCPWVEPTDMLDIMVGGADTEENTLWNYPRRWDGIPAGSWSFNRFLCERVSTILNEIPDWPGDEAYAEYKAHFARTTLLSCDMLQ
ncbi:hypothetical protein CYLTODRAFT_460588 [Cylindrobasidium torrendii FP15055 ss-10]|uniref:CCHC-type domain-containing protein n=1 Tax=Cylindrobasidium torrendii FP15055 ss-10 TaxID=1314674 RepID=A0A0D7ATK3_9AGAR|nr:hypothetical protein CYLTODRAFT_460588 [Cylindrobasidium torrendii FP15055 ss-10]